jgi:hypothetical protein
MADMKQIIVEQEELNVLALVCLFAIRDMVLSLPEKTYLKSLYMKVTGEELRPATPGSE